jgi:FkbM family methyltransferase
MHERNCVGSLEYGSDARAFFEPNAERIKFIAGLFCDEESKKTFLGMINFRQTGKKSDHIYHGIQNQYFINDFFSYGKNEVLIDCGAFNGDTIEAFLKLPNMEYEQIIAFEPGTENFNLLKKKFGNRQNFMLINAGAYSEDSELYFSGNLALGHISEISTGVKGETSIKVKAIDNLENIKKVTFIKMDIEGTEMDALKGAEKTILRDKPRLAICIYHSNEDMLRIAEWIHSLVPEYKLYCRQHDEYPRFDETVLYAQI